MKNRYEIIAAIISLVAFAPFASADDKRDKDEISTQAYFNDTLWAIKLKRDKPKPIKPRESDVNSIYVSDDLVDGRPFKSVIGLRPDDDFDDDARKVKIQFVAGHPAYQLTSERAVADALRNGDITVTPTQEMFDWKFDDDKQKLRVFFYDQFVKIELKQIKPKLKKSSDRDDDDEDRDHAEINTIYVSDDLVNGQPFTNVVGVLPDEDLEEKLNTALIHFNVPAYQLTSEQAIADAVQRGDVTLKQTAQFFKWDEDDLEDIFENLIFITQQPQSQSVPVGTDVTFRAAARSEHKFRQQWFFNGTAIAGATNTAYTVQHAQVRNMGAYTIVFANRYYSVTSAPAYLTILSAIISQPTDQIFICGSNAVFSVAAIGSNLTYQWLFNGQPILGETNATLVLNNVGPSNVGKYSVQVTSAGGTITSQEATLLEETPLISKLLIETDGVMLLCWPRGCTKFKMQESTNGIDWTTIMAPVGMIFETNCMTVPISSNAFRLVHSDLVGPTILAQPSSLSTGVGSSLLLSISATGSPTLFYQWKLNGESLLDSTNSDLSLVDMTLTNFGTYEVTVFNACSAVNSGLIVVSPSGFEGGFASEPIRARNFSAMQGTLVEMTAFLTNWFSWTAPVDGIVHFDTVGSSFDTLLAVFSANDSFGPKVTDDDSGGFKRSAVLFNAHAGQTNLIAISGVGDASGTVVLRWYYESTQPDHFIPEIAIQPRDVVTSTGGFAGFFVSVPFDPDGPFPSYQWRLNGTNILGATGSGLTITNVQDSDLGFYTVEVTINGLSVESRPASLQTTTGPLGVYFVPKPSINYAPPPFNPLLLLPNPAQHQGGPVLQPAAAADDTSQGTTISTSGATGTSPIGQPPPCLTNSFVTFYITNFVTAANTKMVMLHTRGSTTVRSGTNAALDTIVSAITGSITNVVACNNNDAFGFAPASYLYFPATNNTRYIIRVDTPSSTVRAGTILKLTSRMDTNVVATASP